MIQKFLNRMKKRNSKRRLWAEVNQMPQSNIRDELVVMLQNQA